MDLNEPLGVGPRKRGWRFGKAALLAIGAVAALAVAVFVLTADPRGGEPFVVATIPPAPISRPTLLPDPTPTGSLAPQPRDADTPPSAEAQQGVDTIEGGVKVFRGPGERAAQRQADRGPLVIDVTRSLDDPLHRKAAVEAQPSVGAAPLKGPPSPAADRPSTGGMPRVAIFVSGMGLSLVATRTATEIMPAPVDFAFVPYGETVQASVDAAKAKGHEILLQIPMQTSQIGVPGPHALKPGELPTALTEDIGWLTSRIKGFTGVTNLLGAPVTADRAAMSALLQSVASRGLFYLDDGTSKRSLAGALGPSLGATVLQADVVLDATNDTNVVRANLEKLVAIARQKGVAIGMASGLPDHMAEIARFAGDLQGKGIDLVPVGALASRDPNVATSR